MSQTPVNGVYRKVTFRVLIMRRQNADLKKGVNFGYNLVAVYLKPLKIIPQVMKMKS